MKTFHGIAHRFYISRIVEIWRDVKPPGYPRKADR
jgi:hypothetical protein